VAKSILQHLYLLIFFLLISLTISIAIIINQGTNYWYDEVIVTNISQQPLFKMLDSIKGEPHPIGLYFVLKMMPTENAIKTRLVTTLISYLLIICSLVFLAKKSLLQKGNVVLGLMMCTLSVFWFTSATSVKHEFISLPLLILYLFLWLKHIEQSGSDNFRYISFLTIVMLLFSYLFFFKMVILTLVLFIVSKDKKSMLLHLISIAGFTLLYIIFFGLSQYKINIDRQFWWDFSGTNPFILLLNTIGGTVNAALALSIFALSVMLAVIGLNTYSSKVKTHLWTTIIVLIVLDFIILSPVRDRYIGEVIILTSLLGGLGLNHLLMKVPRFRKILLFLVTAILFINSIVNFYVRNQMINFYAETNQFIDQNIAIANKKTLITERHPISPFIRKIGYFSDNYNAVPINILANTHIEHTEISKELILQDQFHPDLDQAEIKRRLADTNIDRILYVKGNLSEWSNLKWYYDPNHRVISVLTENCTTLETSYSILLFENCNFN
jgi:hypothetical protein